MVKVDACADTLPAQELMQRWQTQLNASGRKVLLVLLLLMLPLLLLLLLLLLLVFLPLLLHSPWPSPPLAGALFELPQRLHDHGSRLQQRVRKLVPVLR